MRNIGKTTMLALLVAAVSMTAAGCKPRVQRVAMVTGLKADKIEDYKVMQRNTWPQVRKMFEKCHIRNYSIYVAEVEPGKYYLFSYFEYVGKDMVADFQKMSEDPAMQDWWKLNDQCQIPVPTRAENEKIWHVMEEVFRNE